MPLTLDMKILVVDDSGTMRLMFKKMLKEVGFGNIILANNGKDAISKINDNKFDLIISDWNMPVMDGLEFLKWLRKDKSYDEIPFIMATAQGDKTQENKVYSEGGNSHLSKPFDARELKDKIDESFGFAEKKEKKAEKKKNIDGKVLIRVGHIQITDHLSLGVLRYLILSGVFNPKHFELETVCKNGWNPIQKELESGLLDCAFVLAPIAMDLFAFDVPIKLTSLAHKNGSSFVRNAGYKPENYKSLKDYYKYKEVEIPHKMSIHHMMAHKFLTDMGLSPGVPGQKKINVRFEVVPPVKMPEIMKKDDGVGGFIVAEPIGSNAIKKDIAELEFSSSQIWKDHPCCVVVMQDDFISEFPEAAYEFTELLVKAGQYIDNNKKEASEIAVDFLDPYRELGLKSDIIKNVLEMNDGIKMGELYPSLEDLDTVQRYMYNEMGIGVLIDIEKFADLRFIKSATE